jgi:WD40 repeat protein/serine/threonine protein kinase
MALEKIGSYEIETVIGRGEMSTIYRAHDLRDGRLAAVKVFSSDCLNDPTIRARYQHEFQLITFLNNPCIVPLYEFGEQDGQLFIAMQWMSGGSLADRLAQGPLPFDEAVDIIQQVSQALEAVHDLGIFHGDIKPSNILFDSEGKACLSDFGMIKMARARATKIENMLFGPPGYISPEQAEAGEPLDNRSDVYMLAVVLYESLTGRLPYQANSPLGYTVQHAIAPLPNLLEINPKLPPGCAAVLQQALAKDPAARYPSASQFARAVAEVEPQTAVQSEAQDQSATKILSGEMPEEPLARTLPTVEASAPSKTRRSARPAGRIRKRSYNADRVRLLAGLVLLSLLLGGALILGKQMIGPLGILFESGKKAPTYGAALVNTLSATYTHPGLPDTEEALSSETSTVTPTIAPSPPPPPPATEAATSQIVPTVTVVVSPTARPFTPRPEFPSETPTWAMGTPTPTPVNATNYKIQYGDTLFTIALQFHVVMNELMGVNSLKCNSLLPVAKEIVIPSSYWITLPKYAPISVNLARNLELLQILDCAADVTAIKFSPDGEVMAVASGNFVYLWQVNGWKPLARLKGHTGKVNSLDFSPDNRTLATGADDSTVRVWNASDGALIGTFKGHTNKVTHVAFSPGGQIIASTSLDQTVRLWGTDGSLLTSLRGYPAFSVVFSSSGDTFVVGYTDGAKLYRTDDLKEIQAFSSTDVVRQLAFSPDGNILASSSDAWRVVDGQRIYHFGSYGDQVSFSNDGQILAIGKHLYRISNGNQIVALKSPVTERSRTQNIWDSAAFSPDSRLLAWGTPDGLFLYTLPLGTTPETGSGSNTYIVQPGDTFWNIAAQFQVKPASLRSENSLSCSSVPFVGQRLTIPSVDNRPAELLLGKISASNVSQLQITRALDTQCVLATDNLYFSADGKALISGSAVWQVDTGSVIVQSSDFPLQLSGEPERNLPSPVLVMSPVNQVLAIRSGNLIGLWDVSTGRLLRTLQGHTGPVTSLAFSPDGTMLASGSGVYELNTRIWSVADGSQIETIYGWSAVNLWFTPDGQFIISESEKSVRSWPLGGERLVFTLTGVEGNLTLSPDGTLLAYATCIEWKSNTCQQKETIIVSVANGESNMYLKAYTKDIQDIHFSPDGQTLAVATGNMIILHRVSDWSIVHRLYVSGNLDKVQKIFYSADSSLLFSTSGNGTLRVYDLASGDLLYTFAGSGVDDIAFSPDNTLMAVLRANAVTLWAVAP